jgi:tight adherence protein B
MASQLLPVLAALLIFTAGALVFMGIHYSRARASTPEIEDRLERLGTVAQQAAATTNDAHAASVITDRIDRAVKGKTWAEQTMTALARADLKITLGEFLAVRGASTLVMFLVGLFLGRGAVALAFLFGIVGAMLGWVIPAIYLKFRAKRRQKAFVNQLGDTIALMANSLRAGYSLLQTMELISREAPAPMSEEFRRVVREVGLGISPQQAMDNLLRRVPSEDLDLMVSAINIQHEIGGNLGQILDVIGETISERVRIQGEISVLTAQQQMAGTVIALMPVGLGAALFALNPSYMSNVLVWPWMCIPIGALVMVVIGYFAMQKICAIDV